MLTAIVQLLKRDKSEDSLNNKSMQTFFERLLATDETTT